MNQMTDITALLIAVGDGDLIARDALINQLYSQLHDLAHSQIKRTGNSHTLCTTAVVNEAYLRLFGKQNTSWQNRQHFFGCAAMAMRQLLIDYARRSKADKRNPEVPMPSLQPEQADTVKLNLDELIQLDEALTQLQATDERLGDLVHLRFFSGLNVEQISELYNCSSRTVVRDWRRARAFLNAVVAS